MINIVVDANIIFRSKKRLMQGPEFDLLTERRHRDSIRLVVPALVIGELVELFRRDLSDAIFKLERDCGRLSGHLQGGAVTLSGRPDVDEETRQYESALLRRIRELGCYCPGHLDIPPEALLARRNALRRPFMKADDSDSDTLIWLIILHKLANPDDEVHLLSDDGGFRASKKGKSELHPDLVEDIGGAQLKATAIVLWDSVSACWKGRIRPQLNILQREESEIEKATFLPHLEPFLDSYFDDIHSRIQELLSQKLEELSALAQAPVGLAYLSSLTLPGEIRTLTRSPLDDERELWSLQLRCDVGLEFAVDKHEAYDLDEREGFSVHDWDFNKYMAEATFEGEMDIDIELIVRPDELTSESWDVTAVDFVQE